MDDVFGLYELRKNIASNFPGKHNLYLTCKAFAINGKARRDSAGKILNRFTYRFAHPLYYYHNIEIWLNLRRMARNRTIGPFGLWLMKRKIWHMHCGTPEDTFKVYRLTFFGWIEGLTGSDPILTQSPRTLFEYIFYHLDGPQLEEYTALLSLFILLHFPLPIFQ